MEGPATGDATTARLGAPLEPSAAGDAGALVLGRYRLLERIGAGGFGVVWAALDERLQREVAVKVVPRERGAHGARAEREALAAARLNHPGIVALYELGSDDERVYLVSELVAGGTLGELARAGSLSDRDVARIGVALCDALAHAHARGVIHRDVKPQNVLVVDEPAAGAGFAKLTDFGVAHLATGDALTGTGDVVGTLAYMAPEQAEGARVTPAADVYSLALTLYELWTGSNPVRAGTPAATARRLGARLPALRRRRRDLPPELDALDAALDPRPEARPRLEDLRAALDAAEPLLSDEGGLVEPGAIERAAAATARWRTARTRHLERPAAEEGAPRAGRLAGVAGRLGAGTGAGALVAVALVAAGPAPPLDPAAAGAGAGALVALLPRAGWLAAALAVVGWLLAEGRTGTALVVAAALAPVPLLLPRAPLLWSAPALAPLLGAAALAPLHAAAAGLASTAWRRGALAALGLAWLAAAELLSGERLFAGPPDAASAHERWDGSATAAAAGALEPLATSGVLAPALAWAALAALLPLVVGGRALALDVAGAALWAVALVAAQAALVERLAPGTSLAEPRGALAGAALGAVLAIAVAGLRAGGPLPAGAAEPRPASSMGPR